VKNKISILIISLFTFISLLTFTSVSYSKIITLKDCYGDIKDKSFNKDIYEDYKFVIDTDKKIVNQMYVWTDKEIQKQTKQIQDIIKKRKDSGQKYKDLESLLVMDKIVIGKYNINFIDNNYVNAELDEKGNMFNQYINVIIHKKTVEYTIENKQDKTKRKFNFFCK
jgi:hypothetical protein